VRRGTARFASGGSAVYEPPMRRTTTEKAAPAADLEAPRLLTVGEGAAARRIAVRLTAGGGPAVVWLGGFRSDMRSTKAAALAAWGSRLSRAVLRFDYSGHGESEGRFEDGTIGAWLEESLAVIEAFGGERPILVGSSMGGWIALLAARRLAERGTALSGLVLIAPAPDFTEDLMWNAFSEEVRREILQNGAWLRHSDYSPEPYPITRRLIEEGRSHLLLSSAVRAGCPVHILQGMQDPDVPWRHALRLVERLAEDDVLLTLVKDGDHRLSRPEDLERIFSALEAVAPAA
jgi:pimeloyl-ACP methyl ester carboxylesterase